jgi:hypothetical protein
MLGYCKKYFLHVKLLTAIFAISLEDKLANWHNTRFKYGYVCISIYNSHFPAN